MDFKGQKTSEYISTVLVSVFAAVAFVLGYVLQSFNLMMALFTAGVGLAFLITVPDWWVYNQHPLEWLPPLSGRAAATKQQQQRRRQSPNPSNLWGFL